METLALNYYLARRREFEETFAQDRILCRLLCGRSTDKNANSEWDNDVIDRFMAVLNRCVRRGFLMFIKISELNAFRAVVKDDRSTEGVRNE